MMKKLCLILAMLMLLSCLGGCAAEQEEPAETYTLVEVQPLEGDALEVDTKGMKEYTMDCGLTFFGPSGMKEEKTEAMAGYMKGNYHLVMVIREEKNGTVLENATAEEYAAMLAGSNGLNPFRVDRYGNLATTYTAEGYEDANEDFFYYVTVKEGHDCIWLIQIVCPVSISDESADNMAKWSATFREVE